MKKHPITAVGIGPGDPDMITVKGLKSLQQAEVVFYPVSKLTENEEQSFSRKILDFYDLKAPLHPMLLPMTLKDRGIHYAAAFEQIVAAHEQGKRVAVVAQGDLLFYSTLGYLIKMIKSRNIPVDIISGVPAFVYAASQIQETIAEGKQKITVLPRPTSFEKVLEALKNTETLVVMKPVSIDGWSDFLEKHELAFSYAEKVGTSEQFITSSTQHLRQREIPYFSLLIIKKS